MRFLVTRDLFGVKAQAVLAVGGCIWEKLVNGLKQSSRLAGISPQQHAAKVQYIVTVPKDGDGVGAPGCKVAVSEEVHSVGTPLV